MAQRSSLQHLCQPPHDEVVGNSWPSCMYATILSHSMGERAWTSCLGFFEPVRHFNAGT